jgi:PilZ domain
LTNQFRASVLAGKTPGKPDQLLPGKHGHGAEADDLSSVEVSREETRAHNHRWNNRHRLTGESAGLRHRGTETTVELVNLSAGGAMIRGTLELKLWESVWLVLGEGGMIECAVRWIRRDRFGLEFAHETQIHCEKEQRDALLLEVIRRSFPDVALDRPVAAVEPEEVVEPEETDDEVRRSEDRHPLIWMADIHFNHDTDRVRLRNISSHGALIEGECCYPVGATLLLDMAEAGQHFALVCWSRGPQAGLSFERPFDVSQLASMKPMVMPKRWARPTFLRTSTEPDSPWAQQWNRASLEELKAELEGYMKR